MLKKLVLSSFFVILILSNICFAQGNWMITSGGCKVWNPAPEEGETASWAGQCQNGLVQGHGVIKWFKFNTRFIILLILIQYITKQAAYE